MRIGRLWKDGDLDLAHPVLRKARGASEADPDTAAKMLSLINDAQRLGFR